MTSGTSDTRFRERKTRSDWYTGTSPEAACKNYDAGGFHLDLQVP